MNKTFSEKPARITRSWHLIDAKDNTLGRISTQAANLLIGKGKTNYTPHVDGGDFVVVINTAKIKVTGNKSGSKHDYRHSGYPGGIKSQTLQDQLENSPDKVIESSIRGMLPVNKLRAGRLARLKIYTGADHPHSGQLAAKEQTPAKQEEK